MLKVRFSNRTLVEVNGQAAKSAECIVSGGEDNDIAQAIYDNIAAGIEWFGRNGTSGTAVDPIDGQEFEVFFTRPVAKYIHVRYTRIDNNEQSYPVDGDTQVKNACAEFGNARYSLGSRS